MYLYLEPHHTPGVKKDIDVIERVVFDYVNKLECAAVAFEFDILLLFHGEGVGYKRHFFLVNANPGIYIGIGENIGIDLQFVHSPIESHLEMKRIAFFGSDYT